jgi:hypothetical protein
MMSGAALVLYGLYIAAVTYHDNLPTLLSGLPEAKGYFLWMIVILILALAASIPAIEPVVIGIAILIGLAYLLSTWPTISQDGSNLLTTFGL